MKSIDTLSFYLAPWRWKKWQSILFMVVILTIIYSAALNNPFIWDDYFHVVENTFIKDWRYIPQIFTSDVFFFAPQRSNFYRPLQSLSYMIDYTVWKLNPLGYHLTNVLIHLFNIILIYLLLSKLFQNRFVPFLSAFFFTIHPLQTSAVSYIAGRADLLLTFFCLCSLSLYFESQHATSGGMRGRLYYVVSIIAFIFALLSKEAALIFPIFLVVFDYFFPVKEKSHTARYKKIVRYLPFFIAAALYLILRITVLHFPLENIAPADVTLYQRIITAPQIIISYMGLLLIPLDLRMERVVSLSPSFLRQEVILPLIALISLFVFAIRGVRRSPGILFGLLWFFIFLIPTLNIIIPLNAMMAEHWLYLSSVGFFMVISFLLHKGLNTKYGVLKVVISGLIITSSAYYCLRTYQRNIEWGNEILFFEKILQHSGGWDIDRVHMNLAKAYYRQEKYDLAKQEVKQTLEINPRYFEAYCLLGVLSGGEGDYDTSIKYLQEAIRMNPSYVAAYHNKAITYAKMGKLRLAVAEWEKALKLNPYYRPAQVNIEKARRLIGNE